MIYLIEIDSPVQFDENALHNIIEPPPYLTFFLSCPDMIMIKQLDFRFVHPKNSKSLFHSQKRFSEVKSSIKLIFFMKKYPPWLTPLSALHCKVCALTLVPCATGPANITHYNSRVSIDFTINLTCCSWRLLGLSSTQWQKFGYIYTDKTFSSQIELQISVCLKVRKFLHSSFQTSRHN